MRIRDLALPDVAAVTAINQANTPAVGDETHASMEAILRQCSIALGVEAEEGLVGFCYVLPPGAEYASANYRWFSARYESFAYLDRVAFADGHRGRGYGAALYREVEARATGDADWFLLEVNLRPRNDGSLRFHAREGFVEVGQQEANGKLVSMLAKPL